MFADQFAGAIACAQFTDLADLAHKLWKAFDAGHIDEAQVQALSEQLEARKPKGQGLYHGYKLPKPRRSQRSPAKQASIARRRRLARASPVPPDMIGEFTTCEHAVITIMIEQIRKHGVCSLCMDAIAALAGTCRTMVRNAMRKARALGLLYRAERRRRGQKSLTNLVQIIKPSWRRWVLWIGRRISSTTKDKDSKTRASNAVDSFKQGVGGVGFARSVPIGSWRR